LRFFVSSLDMTGSSIMTLNIYSIVDWHQPFYG